jgi:DNA modification methylase
MKQQIIKLTKIVENKGQIEGLPRNPRQIKDEKYKLLKKSIEDDPEMLELRELLVYPHNNKFVVIGGNMRLKVLRELGVAECPCKVIPEETPIEKLRAYTIKDNNSFGEYDFDLLGNDWEVDELLDWGCDLPDITIEEETKEAVEDDYSEEDAQNAESIVKRGEIWQLGEHRLMCGDSTCGGDVALLMNGEKADMVFTDPPYGMKKEKEGVLNDNLNFDDLLDFNKKWIPLSFMNTKSNGSWYCWGIDEPLMDIYSEILKPMQKENKITFRNFITWKKESNNPTMLYNGACSSGFRKFYSNEKCLFVMCGVQGFNNNQDNYFDGWENIRSYLEGEAKKVGLNNEKLKEICGVGMYSHWFTKSQWGLITEEHYLELQKYYKNNAFKREYDELKREYDELKREYDELKREYYETRAFFEAQSNNVDVWVYDVAPNDERTDHATPKPIELCSRAIKSSSRINERVLDLFGGSGSTLIACEQLNRKCYMMELDEHYCDVIIDRWQKLTGKTAVKIEQQ